MHRLLYVEDDPINVQLFERIVLLTHGFSLDIARDGRTARTMLQTGLPDLMFLDLHLPDESGLDLLRYVRGLAGGLDLPVYAVSASPMKQIEPEIRTVGFLDYLEKPLKAPLIMDILNNYNRSRQS